MTNEERDALLNKMDTTLSQISVSLEGYHRVIYGNGHPGLLTRVKALEDTSERHERNDAELFGKCNQNKERIVALETSGGGWKQAITWLLAALAVVIAYVKTK